MDHAVGETTDLATSFTNTCVTAVDSECLWEMKALGKHREYVIFSIIVPFRVGFQLPVNSALGAVGSDHMSWLVMCCRSNPSQ